MDHFLEGTALIRYWFIIIPKKKCNKYNYSLQTSQLSKALTEHHILQGNVQLRHFFKKYKNSVYVLMNEENID